ncbi:hypothetical protein ALC60_13073 [Trachymyrmex zeteki]|uniref:Uncharacterized protein n=1 Tax=Mycetomoellerius zeteki TaxID=64791 RepID=A0A151WJ50_9HYME|nr:hypothetical protein ALC60_13073 [Trachymyrmex zeteki]
MERHAGARGISLDKLKLKRAMCRKDAAELSCDTQRRRLPEKESNGRRGFPRRFYDGGACSNMLTRSHNKIDHRSYRSFFSCPFFSFLICLYLIPPRLIKHIINFF